MRLAALLLLVVACAPAADNVPQSWFAAWADDFSAGDHVGMARFYDPLVEVDMATPDFEISDVALFTDTTTSGVGRAWLVEWLDGATTTQKRSLGEVTVDGDTALVPLTVTDLDVAAMMVMQLDDGLIASQSTLRWRYAHKPGGTPDGRLTWLDTLVEAHVAPRRIAVTTAGTRSFPAVFVTAGPDTKLAVVVLEPAGDCTGPDAVWLTLDDGSITDQRDFRSPNRCPGVRTGQWRSLEVPGQVEETVSGLVDLAGPVALYNSTPELEALLWWSFDRFQAAGLAFPELAGVSFAPADACVRRGGLTTPSSDGAHVVVCVDTVDACDPSPADCAAFTTPARLGLLHELGHAWLLDHIDAATRMRFLEFSALEAWADTSAPWHDRGVEQAAEILAWGLMTDPPELVRLGRPPCGHLVAGYTILTGRSPAHECPTGS
jgi:hypothetical protein